MGLFQRKNINESEKRIFDALWKRYQENPDQFSETQVNALNELNKRLTPETTPSKVYDPKELVDEMRGSDPGERKKVLSDIEREFERRKGSSNKEEFDKLGYQRLKKKPLGFLKNIFKKKEKKETPVETTEPTTKEPEEPKSTLTIEDAKYYYNRALEDNAHGGKSFEEYLQTTPKFKHLTEAPPSPLTDPNAILKQEEVLKESAAKQEADEGTVRSEWAETINSNPYVDYDGGEFDIYDNIFQTYYLWLDELNKRDDMGEVHQEENTILDMMNPFGGEFMKHDPAVSLQQYYRETFGFFDNKKSRDENLALFEKALKAGKLDAEFGITKSGDMSETSKTRLEIADQLPKSLEEFMYNNSLIEGGRLDLSKKDISGTDHYDFLQDFAKGSAGKFYRTMRRYLDEKDPTKKEKLGIELEKLYRETLLPEYLDRQVAIKLDSQYDFVDALVDNFWNNPHQVLPLGDWYEGWDIAKMLKNANRFTVDPESLSDDELQKLLEFVEYTEFKGTATFWGGVVDIVAQMPAFGLEYLITSKLGAKGASSSKKIVQELVGDALMDKINKLVRTGIKDKISKHIASRGIVKGTGKVITEATKVGAIGLGGSTVSGKVNKEYLMNQMPGLGVTEEGELEFDKVYYGMDKDDALIHALIGGGIEFSSEALGPYFSKAALGGKKLFKYLLGTKGGEKVINIYNKAGDPTKEYILNSAVVKAFKKANPFTTDADIKKVLDSVGYHGVIEEMMEERAGDALRAVFQSTGVVEDESWEWSLPSWKQIGQELVAFTIPGVTASTISRTKKKVKEEKLKSSQEEFVSKVEESNKKVEEVKVEVKETSKKVEEEGVESLSEEEFTKHIKNVETINNNHTLNTLNDLLIEDPSLASELDLSEVALEKEIEITAKQLEAEGVSVEGEGMNVDQKTFVARGYTTFANLKLKLGLGKGANYDTVTEEYYGLVRRGGLSDSQEEIYNQHYEKYKTDKKYRKEINQFINNMAEKMGNPIEVADVNQTLSYDKLFDKEGKSYEYKSNQDKKNHQADSIFEYIKNLFSSVFDSTDKSIQDVYKKVRDRKLKVSAKKAQTTQERREARVEERKTKAKAKKEHREKKRAERKAKVDKKKERREKKREEARAKKKPLGKGVDPPKKVKKIDEKPKKGRPSYQLAAKRAYKYLPKDTKKQEDRLRKSINRDESVAQPKNKSIVFENNDFRITIGDKTFDDWVKDVEKNLTSEEIIEAANWYDDVYNEIAKVVPRKDVEKVFMSWLIAQKQESPIGAFGGTLKVKEEVELDIRRTKPKTGDYLKSGGLSDENMRRIFRDIPIEGGVGAKLLDFVDSAINSPTRFVVGNKPEGGAPYVVDRHTWNGRGYVSPVFLRYIEKAFGKNSTKGLLLDNNKDDKPSDTQYDQTSIWGNELTDYLNEINWQGKSDWTTPQIQAIDWTSIVKFKANYGKVGGTIQDAIKENTAIINFETVFGEGTKYEKDYPEIQNFSYEDLAKFTNTTSDFINKVVDEVLRPLNIATIQQTGGWLDYGMAPSVTRQVLIPKDRIETAFSIIGYLSQQTEVMGFRPNPKGKDMALWFSSESFRDPKVADTFYRTMRERHPDIFQGYSSGEFEGVPSLIVYQFVNAKGNTAKKKEILDNKIKEVVDLIESDITDYAKTLDNKIDYETQIVDINSVSNDWKENKNGESYLQRINETLGQEVQDRITGQYRKEYKSILDQEIKQKQKAPQVSYQLTPTQKEFFKDTKVVDSKGNPKVVYHGTPNSFEVFKETKDIGFHAGTSDQANQRLIKSRTLGDIEYDEGANIMPLYMNIENPMYLTDLDNWYPDDVSDAIEAEYGFKDVPKFSSVDTSSESYKEIVDYIKSKGFDGIIYRNELEDALALTIEEQKKYDKMLDAGKLKTAKKEIEFLQQLDKADGVDDLNAGLSYIAFDANQIKSATAMAEQPTKDPRISYQLAPKEDALDIYDDITGKEKFGKDAKKERVNVYNSSIIPISTLLKRMHPKLYIHLLKHQFNVAEKTSEFSKMAEPLVKILTPTIKKRVKRYVFGDRLDKKSSREINLPTREINTFKLAMLNSDATTMESVIQKYDNKNKDFMSAYKNARDVLDLLRQELIDVGEEVGLIDDYFPRKVSNYSDFEDYIYKNKKTKTLMESQLRKAEKAKGASLSQAEKAEIIGMVIRGHSFTGSKPGYLKGRKIDKITRDMVTLYRDPAVQLLNHIGNVVERVEVKKYLGISNKDFVEKTTAEKTALYEQSVGDLLQRLIRDDGYTLTPRQEKEYAEILTAYFSFTPISEGYGAVKTIMYGFFLGNITNTITQLQDMGYAIYENKLGQHRTIKNMAIYLGSRIKNIDRLKRESIGVDIPGLELKITSKSGFYKAANNFTNGVFTISGFRLGDGLGKSVVINSAIQKYKSRAQKNRLSRKDKDYLKLLFGDQYDQAIEELKQKTSPSEYTENEKFIAYATILKYQPIGKTEVPLKYLQFGGAGRTFYMLKTFAIQQLNVIRNESWDIIFARQKIAGKKPTARQRTTAIGNMFYLMGLLVMMGVGKDEIINWLYGKDEELDELAKDNLLKLFLFSKFELNKIARESNYNGILKSIGETAAESVWSMPTVDFVWNFMKIAEETFLTTKRSKLPKYLFPIGSILDNNRYISEQLGIGGRARDDYVVRKIKDLYKKSHKQGIDLSDSELKEYRKILKDFDKYPQTYIITNKDGEEEVKKRINTTKHWDHIDNTY